MIKFNNNSNFTYHLLVEFEFSDYMRLYLIYVFTLNFNIKYYNHKNDLKYVVITLVFI